MMSLGMEANTAIEDFQNYWHHDEVDGDLDFIKLKIPNFQGKNNPKTYLE
jgi:hypothetical protein